MLEQCDVLEYLTLVKVLILSRLTRCSYGEHLGRIVGIEAPVLSYVCDRIFLPMCVRASEAVSRD